MSGTRRRTKGRAAAMYSRKPTFVASRREATPAKTELVGLPILKDTPTTKPPGS
jgi:hypothetical protein